MPARPRGRESAQQGDGMNSQNALAQVPLFRGLSPQYLDRLQRVARDRSYSPGETIVQQGELGIAFFVITSGKVEVLQGNGDVVNRLHAGDSFGELALLDDMPRQATVRAVDGVTCLALPRLDFLDALRDQPEIAVQLLKSVAEMLRHAEARAGKTQAATN
jgi:CRP-like cAMP-binding protein